MGILRLISCSLILFVRYKKCRRLIAVRKSCFFHNCVVLFRQHRQAFVFFPAKFMLRAVTFYKLRYSYFRYKKHLRLNSIYLNPIANAFLYVCHYNRTVRVKLTVSQKRSCNLNRFIFFAIQNVPLFLCFQRTHLCKLVRSRFYCPLLIRYLEFKRFTQR